MGKCLSQLANPELSTGEEDHKRLSLKSTMDLSDEEEGNWPAAVATSQSSLRIFHEDILLSILSYVADVPFEMMDTAALVVPSTHSTLTHTLPLVSKQFHKITQNHDLYWKSGLLRLLHKEPMLWAEGMKRVIFDSECDEIRDEIAKRIQSQAERRRDKRAKNDQLNYQTPQSVFESKISASRRTVSESSPDSKISPAEDEDLLEQACAAIQSHPPRHHTASSSGMYQCLYRSILLRHLRYQGPVFIMDSLVRLGDPYGLHFFEPRYRVLISEVMARYSVSARRGEQIVPSVPGIFPPTSHSIMDDDIKSSVLDLVEKNQSLLGEYHLPTFIHAHRGFRSNCAATIVQVQICSINPNGSADVLLKPIAYIWIEKIWERRGTGGLYEARGIRMGAELSERFERWCNMGAYGMGDGRGRRLQLPMP